MHPLATTWKPGTSSTSWNVWSNWTNGIPWDCTNVIIPSDSRNYPVLKSKEQNYCHYIHFEPGAEVINTHYLHYEKAWVELSLTPGRYYMLSAVLNNTMTGDMFIPASMDGTQNNAVFSDLDATSSPANRFNPRIFQRLWSNNATGKKLTGDVTVTPDETNWTPPFNAVNQRYALGNGFSLMVDKGTVTKDKCTFRFPKEHTTYYYYNAAGAPQGSVKASVDRDLRDVSFMKHFREQFRHFRLLYLSRIRKREPLSWWEILSWHISASKSFCRQSADNLH